MLTETTTNTHPTANTTLSGSTSPSATRSTSTMTFTSATTISTSTLAPGIFQSTIPKLNFLVARKYTFFSHSYYCIQCFISDNYNYLEGRYCQGSNIGSYTTLHAAKAACSNNYECGCIWEEECDGDEWKISKGNTVFSSSYGSCAWAGKLKFSFHTRKQIYTDNNIRLVRACIL